MTDQQKAQYGTLPTVVFQCINCHAAIQFHKDSEQWRVRG